MNHSNISRELYLDATEEKDPEPSGSLLTADHQGGKCSALIILPAFSQGFVRQQLHTRYLRFR
jgi:hypothetical protein